jgi:hypothetical protein|tara:strand:- start:10490 stop:10624 length:135 start_codon:yes stop_codon:yes gene_type:complete
MRSPIVEVRRCSEVVGTSMPAGVQMISCGINEVMKELIALSMDI